VVPSIRRQYFSDYYKTLQKKEIIRNLLKTYYHEAVGLTLFISLVSLIILQGCAYRFGASAFSFKKKVERPQPQECQEITSKTERRAIPLESVKAKVIKEPSETDPILVLSLTNHVIKKTMVKRSYQCTREILWKPEGRYIYDPIEIGFYSTLLTYRATALRDEKTLADWLFLSTGWIFAGIDYFTFGIWGVTGGPVLDTLVPAWEKEPFQVIRFAEQSDFCKMGPITFLALGTGLPVCLFRSEVQGSDNITENVTQRFAHPVISSHREHYIKETDWELEDVEEKYFPLSGGMIARIESQNSALIEFHIDNNGVATIDLEPFSIEPAPGTEMSIFPNRRVIKPLTTVIFNWTGGVKMVQKPGSQPPKTRSDCDDFMSKMSAYKKSGKTVPTKVIRNKTPVYEGEYSSKIIKRLQFNDNVFIRDIRQGRALIGLTPEEEPLGWTDLSLLLCRNKPLRSELGYHIIFFLNTNPEEIMSIKAYSSERLTECYGSCEPMTHTQVYYVYAEKEDSYLLSESLYLDQQALLTGWVDKNAGTLWDTDLGLRPQQGISALCIYFTPSDARKSENCIVVKQEPSKWLGSSERILIVKKDKDLYSVIMPWSIMNTERTISAYIPATADVVEENLLTNDELDRWIQILQKIDSIPTEKTENLHQLFVTMTQDVLEEVAGQPIIDDEQKLSDFLRHKAHLPVREDSPFFQYSLKELRSTETFPLCALMMAKKWIHHVKEILIIIRSGNSYPAPVVIKNYPHEECPAAQNIPFVDGPVQAFPRQSKVSYKSFWIIHDFLP
jgi:hypothetical protein